MKYYGHIDLPEELNKYFSIRVSIQHESITLIESLLLSPWVMHYDAIGEEDKYLAMELIQEKRNEAQRRIME
jgi:hypothetical protein